MRLSSLFLSQEIQQIAVVVGFLLLIQGKSGDDFARFPPIWKMGRLVAGCDRATCFGLFQLLMC